MNDESPEALFYAIFELRCCVEARQEAYAEALAEFDGSRIRPWKVGETRKRIEKTGAGKLISQYSVHFDDGAIFDIHHTPIPQSLSNFIEKQSGDLLHSQKQYRPLNDPWWANTKKEVVAAYQAAWLACQGNAMAPPLWNPQNKQTNSLIVKCGREGDQALLERLANSVGQSYNIRIDYLDAAPSSWICDL